MAKRRTRFITWAKRDPDDERKINYTFRTAGGIVERFTSDDTTTPAMLWRIRMAWIDSIQLINDEWHAVLYED